jgi:hypothetical protein
MVGAIRHPLTMMESLDALHKFHGGSRLAAACVKLPAANLI